MIAAATKQGNGADTAYDFGKLKSTVTILEREKIDKSRIEVKSTLKNGMGGDL